MAKTILVTGGAGYIGSHACVELLESGYSVVVADNLVNSREESLKRVQTITGKSLTFYRIDLRDRDELVKIFSKHNIDAVIHFAGLKAVGESCEQPLRYYDNNINSTLVLLDVMGEAKVNKLVFSSSATVYGVANAAQLTEDMPIGAINPYGRTKAMIEDILSDLAAADKIKATETPWKIALLRYFNPIGAHDSGKIGEDPNGIPNNLMPYVTQVAIGTLPQLSVFGNDYPTPDGTGIRDYIHVVDLVKGHLKAIEVLESESYAKGGCKAYNLGTGTGYSVLEIISMFEQVTGKKVNYRIAPRRPGDLAECFANPDLALKELHWKAEKQLADMIEDTWRWQVNNPKGYS